ncbi:MAG: hypothetical protein K0R63_1016 [Rickettsiales bacterium]|jgi:uncharacterized membrane protein|nr:hypothetical protein [Rickettsiales bacterium]
MKLTAEEIALIDELRALNPAKDIPSYKTASSSVILADKITGILGSWRFVVIQSCLLSVWLVLNILAWVQHWDPYPFILLNLALSFQAAYTAPVILMSQNRTNQVDREKLEYYYRVNLKTELEIELLHQKLDKVLKHHALDRDN